MFAYSTAVGVSFSSVNCPKPDLRGQTKIVRIPCTRRLRQSEYLALSVMVLVRVLAMWLVLVLETGSVPVLVQALVTLRFETTRVFHVEHCH